jgi:hypothetical protein
MQTSVLTGARIPFFTALFTALIAANPPVLSAECVEHGKQVRAK